MEAWQATAQDEAGNVIFNPTVTVYESDGATLASIFNEDGSPKSNPFVGGIEGFCQFWAGPGTYKIKGASGGGETELWDVSLVNESATKEHRKVFWVATGQSNMARQPLYNWTPPENLLWWNNTQSDTASVGDAFVPPAGNRIGASLATAAEYARNNPDVDVYLVNCALGGMPIASWLPGAPAGQDVYQNTIDNVVPALAAAGVSTVDALLWWQGENGGWLGTYPADFETVINRFRTNNWFPRATPTIIFGVTTSARAGQARYDLTNFSLQDIVVANGAYRKFIDSANFTAGIYWDDLVHMSAIGYENVGIMAAKSMMGQSDHIPSRLLGTSPYLIDADAPALGTGDYQTDALTTGLPAATAGVIRQQTFNPNFAIQEFYALTNSRAWRRYKRSGSWLPWFAISGAVQADASTGPAQTVSGTTETTINFPNETLDTIGAYDGTQFTPPAGVWRISAAVRFTSGLEAGERLTLSLKSANLSNTMMLNETYTNELGAGQATLNGEFIANGVSSYVLRLSGTGAGDKIVQGFAASTYFNASAVPSGG